MIDFHKCPICRQPLKVLGESYTLTCQKDEVNSTLDYMDIFLEDFLITYFPESTHIYAKTGKEYHFNPIAKLDYHLQLDWQDMPQVIKKLKLYFKKTF